MFTRLGTLVKTDAVTCQQCCVCTGAKTWTLTCLAPPAWWLFQSVCPISLSLSLLIDSPGKLDGRFGGGILLAQGLFFDCSLKTGAVETFLIVAFIRLADEERRTLSSE